MEANTIAVGNGVATPETIHVRPTAFMAMFNAEVVASWFFSFGDFLLMVGKEVVMRMSAGNPRRTSCHRTILHPIVGTSKKGPLECLQGSTTRRQPLTKR